MFDSPLAVAGGVSCYNLKNAVAAAKSGDTITMLRDYAITTNSQVKIAAGTTLTLDLNGHKYSNTYFAAAISDLGTLTNKDTIGTGTFEPSYIPVVVGDNSTAIFLSGNFEGAEGTVSTGLATGATIEMKGRIFTVSDNAVISGNEATEKESRIQFTFRRYIQRRH